MVIFNNISVFILDVEESSGGDNERFDIFLYFCSVVDGV